LQADSRKTTAILKKHLKAAFGINCSIRSDVFSMGSSLHVTYSMGVDEDVIDSFLAPLQYSKFNSMEDLSEFKEESGMVLDGYELNTYKYVSVKQEFSSEFLFKLAKMFSDSVNFSGVEKLESIENLYSNFAPQPFAGSWSWSNLLHQQFQVRNFVTQDEEKIKLISVHPYEDVSFHDSIYFVYEVDGVQFDTRYIPVKEEVKQEQKNIQEPVKVETGTVQIVEYSEYSVAVIGDTKPIKDKLASLGGRFNARLKCGAGWIFQKTKYNDLVESLKVA